MNGDEFRRLRLSTGLTSAKIADKLQVNKSTLSRLENSGEKIVKASYVIALKSILEGIENDS